MGILIRFTQPQKPLMKKPTLMGHTGPGSEALAGPQPHLALGLGGAGMSPPCPSVTGHCLLREKYHNRRHLMSSERLRWGIATGTKGKGPGRDDRHCSTDDPGRHQAGSGSLFLPTPAKTRHWHFIRCDQCPGNHRKKSEPSQCRCFIVIKVLISCLKLLTFDANRKTSLTCVYLCIWYCGQTYNHSNTRQALWHLHSFLFWDRLSLCGPGLPPIQNAPASISQVAEIRGMHYHTWFFINF
jgi:hypothetical protein